MVITSKEASPKTEIHGSRVSNFGASLLGGGAGGLYRPSWFKTWTFN